MGSPYFRISEVGNLVETIKGDQRDFAEATWKALKQRGDAFYRPKAVKVDNSEEK